MTVQTVDTIDALRAYLDAARSRGSSVGLVPTMGYLHDGHASLIRAAREANDIVVVTIFVNALQFAAHEDLDSYPRDIAHDRDVADHAGADVLFVPSNAEMYPREVLTTVAVRQISDGFEGESRPTHFAGVATVVTKLFAIAGPCDAYFGEKDFQQLALVRRLAADLSFPVAVVGCPTVREPDGLAMSSRNVYLTHDERAVAPVLHRALRAGAEAIETGERSAAAVVDAMVRVVESQQIARLDYFAVLDHATCTRVDHIESDVRLLGAIEFGKARLIDNVGVTVNDGMHRTKGP